MKPNVQYANNVATVIRRGAKTAINVPYLAAHILSGHAGRPTSADIIALAAALDDARRPRCGTNELPPDHRQVLAEVRPRRRNSRAVFVVARYFRPKRGVHDGDPGWFDNAGGDVDVIRWWPIAGEDRA
jgi:hypothetical protein